MDLLLLTSILVRVVALGGSIVLLRRLRDWRVLFLSGMIGLMTAQQCLTLLAAVRDGGDLVVSAGRLEELPALLVSIMALTAVIFLGDVFARTPARSTPADAVRGERLTFVALAIGAVAIVGSCAVGVSAYRASRRTMLDATARGNLQLARTLVNHVESRAAGRSGADRLRHLEDTWADTEVRHPGTFLCVVRAPGVLVHHSVSPDAIGRDVSGLALGEATVGRAATVGELLRRRSDWAGAGRTVTGTEQLVGYAYSPVLDGLVVVHLPLAVVEREVQAAALPWGIGLGLVAGLVIPLALALLGYAAATARRSLAETAEARRTSERRLREAEEMRRAITEHSPDYIMLLDCAGTILFINRTVPDLTIADVIGTPVFRYVPERYHDRMRAAFRQVVETGEPAIYEVDYESKDGDVLTFESRVGAVRRDGTVVALAMSSSDVTERTRTARTLQRFREILAATPDFVGMADARGRAQWVNAAGCEMIGVDGEADVPSMMLTDFHPPAVAERLTHEALPTAARDGVWQGETSFLRRDGTEVRTLQVVLAHKDPQGRVDFYSTIGHDIDDRLRSEAALRESQRRFELLARASPAIVFQTGPQGGGIFCSERWKEFTGLSELAWQGDGWMRGVHPDDRPRVEASWRRAMLAASSWHEELRFRHVDGRVFWMLAQAIPQRDEDGRVEGFIGTCMDITDVKRAAERQRLMMRELDHRVRNNLSSLTSLIDLTARSGRDAADFAESIRTRVLAMAHVHELLSRSHWSPVSLGRMIEVLVPVGAAGTVDLAGPALDVPASQGTAVAMVIQELMTNSLKHGALGVRDGRVRIEWCVDTTDEGETCYRLEWTETGGRLITTPPETGVGTRLVRGLVRSDLRGSLTLSYPTDGAAHRLTIVPEHADAALVTVG
ncbi:MAG: PAS domain S-box protein [Planctomycetota bacterium]